MVCVVTHQGALAVELAAKVADDECQASGAAAGAAAGLDRVVESAGHASDVQEDVRLQVGLGHCQRYLQHQRESKTVVFQVKGSRPGLWLKTSK